MGSEGLGRGGGRVEGGGRGRRRREGGREQAGGYGAETPARDRQLQGLSRRCTESEREIGERHREREHGQPWISIDNRNQKSLLTTYSFAGIYQLHTTFKVEQIPFPIKDR